MESALTWSQAQLPILFWIVWTLLATNVYHLLDGDFIQKPPSTFSIFFSVAQIFLVVSSHKSYPCQNEHTANHHLSRNLGTLRVYFKLFPSYWADLANLIKFWATAMQTYSLWISTIKLQLDKQSFELKAEICLAFRMENNKIRNNKQPSEQQKWRAMKILRSRNGKFRGVANYLIKIIMRSTGYWFLLRLLM